MNAITHAALRSLRNATLADRYNFYNCRQNSEELFRQYYNH
ncbi:hypothetical protein LT85_4643 [Collimonas arenae]|uniref:Uncharacterized protein n=1 Tax=Collimonas arenae TaxID=279058 RepID=A0A0A1FGX8_9BURK|nr:hypothetical protein LT85_4643 [Collimonas arenae]